VKKGKKRCKYRISGVRKKMEIERKVPGKKNQSVFELNFRVKVVVLEKI
jgi:hypothetical protein